MKIFKLIFTALTFQLLLWNAPAYGQLIALVDFMKVPQGGAGEYLNIEREIWKPMHQEWVNQGKMAGWYLWYVPYPSGANAEYHYVTVRIFENWTQLDNPMADMEAVFRKVHPAMDAGKAFERTLAGRDLVKTYRYNRWESFFDPKLTGTPTFITVVYFEVPMEKWGTYQEMERKYFHPTHKAEIEAGCRAGWEGWQLMQPFGMGQSHQFVAVDHYKDWSQYNKPVPEDLHAKVLSATDNNKRYELFFETVRMVSMEEWRLVDRTEPRQETAKK